MARRCLGRVFARHRLETGRGSLDFSHQHVTLGENSISLLRYGSEIEIIAPPLDFYLLQVTLGGRIQLRGAGFETTLEPGSAFVMNPGLGYRKCWDREAQQLLLKISRRRLECRVPAMANSGGAWAIEFASNALPTGALTDPLRQLLNQLGGNPEVSNPGSGQWSMANANVDHVVRAMLAGMPYRTGAYRNSADHCAVPDYVRRAERHLQANFHSAVQLVALAEFTGVSKRTLQEGFKRFRGKAPSQFSRDMRLDMARKALILHGLENVTGIALEFGFTHFGRFAQAYAARFGECPSDTLRRRRSR